jgi:hypothetical protein
MGDNPFKLPLIKPAPSYESPPRVQQPRPEITSPPYSEARVIPPELLEPNREANGLAMPARGGSRAYGAPETLFPEPLTRKEKERENALTERMMLISKPEWINRYERRDPWALQQLANITRKARANLPLDPLPTPPNAPRIRRYKPILFENEPPVPKKAAKRPRNNNTNNKMKTERKRKTRRLKNRRHK